jgi:hypothetical protein
MIKLANIHSELLNDAQRLEIPARLYGLNFSLKLEPAIYSMADMLSADYKGGLWEMVGLSCGSMFMYPRADRQFAVSSMNGYEGSMSAVAFGICTNLFALSHLSFGEGEFAQTCAKHFHLLREFMLESAEASAILRAID